MRKFERIRKRNDNSHAIAIAHVADKMLRMIWHILTTKTLHSSRGNTPYNKKIKRVTELAGTA